MPYQISFESTPSQQDIQVLCDGISAHAKKMKDLKVIDFFAFFIRDAQGKIQGGCNGDNLYGCLYVGQLWVAESLRGQGYGTKLMHAAEQYAKEQNCNFMAVNTMDWEALEFYQKLGFEIEFERHGFAKNSIFYFLRKNLVI